MSIDRLLLRPKATGPESHELHQILNLLITSLTLKKARIDLRVQNNLWLGIISISGPGITMPP